MARRVRRLGGVIFSPNPLFDSSEIGDASLSSSARLTAAGGRVVFVRRISTPYLTIDSGESGWITDAQRIELLEMYRDIETESWEMEYDDGTIDRVRFAWERGIRFDPIYEGSDYYTATINLERSGE